MWPTPGCWRSRLPGISAFVKGPRTALTAFYARAGTLARVPLGGGGPREILEDVMHADWLPGGGELAVIRRQQVEWPIGNVVYTSRLLLTHLRIAHNGDRLALFEGGSVIVLD